MKRICAVILCIGILFCFYGCSQRKAVTQEEFIQASAEEGMSLKSNNAEQVGDEGLEDFAEAESDDAKAEIFIYSDESYAKTVYADALSSIQNEYATVNTRIDSATYSKYYATIGDTYKAVVRVGCMVLYGEQDSQGDTIKNLFKKLGY
jgi:hypothetical protein